MPPDLILASSSEIRRDLLARSAVTLDIQPARIDEASIVSALSAEGTSPRDISDFLADAKAKKIAGKNLGGLVLGSDQVLEFDGEVWAKPASPEQGRDQLSTLRGQTHKLHSAAVLYRDGRPIWRHISTVKLKMRLFSDAYLDDYLARNWQEVRHCVGAYMLEKEGARLMERVDGDYFAVLGLPLVEVLNQLIVLQVIDG